MRKSNFFNFIISIFDSNQQRVEVQKATFKDFYDTNVVSAMHVQLVPVPVPNHVTVGGLPVWELQGVMPPSPHPFSQHQLPGSLARQPTQLSWYTVDTDSVFRYDIVLFLNTCSHVTRLYRFPSTNAYNTMQSGQEYRNGLIYQLIVLYSDGKFWLGMCSF